MTRQTHDALLPGATSFGPSGTDAESTAGSRESVPVRADEGEPVGVRLRGPLIPPARQPTVTVVVPTYRRPEMIRSVITSVSDQTWTDWELLIVDDNGLGTPEQSATEAQVRAFSDDTRVAYYAHDKNLGACAARNTGIRAARGDYVAFLDDDDAWSPIKLERQVRCFEASDPSVALVYGGFRRIYPDGRSHTIMPDGTEHRPPRLLERNSIGSTSLVMCRRAALVTVGGFDERLPSMQDFDLYIRLGMAYPFAWVDDILADHVRHRGPRISTDHTGIVQANEYFYAKHRELFERDPNVHHARLTAYALDMLRAGRLGEARKLYRRAWRIQPRRFGSLLLSWLVREEWLSLYRFTRRWTGSGDRSSDPS